MLDGLLTRTPGGGVTLTFDRRIDRPIEKVWAALTIPERIADWLAEATVELSVGGAFRLVFHGGTDRMDGVITRLEPPRVLEYSWQEGSVAGRSSVLWELEPAEGGCRLRLTHRFPEGVKDVLEFVSGWHQHLDAIPAAAEGMRTEWDRERWRGLYRAYAARAA